MAELSKFTNDQLGDEICTWAGRVAAGEAHLLVLIGEFDRREAWAGPGMLSCAQWLSWRIGLSANAAREQVRVSRRLDELPAVAEAFTDGRVSYSKVRAITRAAEPDDGVDWVALARSASAAQLEKIVRGVRRARANEAAEADPEVAAWALRTRTRYDADGNFTMTISGPAEFLPVIQAGIDAKKAELQRQRDAQAADVFAHAPVDEPETSSPVGDGPAEPPSQAEGAGDVGDGDRAPLVEVVEDVSAETPAAGQPDLDVQAPGWPAGTTGRQVREAMNSCFAAQARRRAEWAAEAASDTDADADADADDQTPIEPASRPRLAPTPVDVSAETPHAAKVSDAEALLALMQDALTAEQKASPAAGRARRPQLTAQIDPLSGWGRQADGELLPPSSLRQVMKTLPGRGGVLRLRPVTAADLRRHDLARGQRVVSAALRELLGTLDGERCRFPGCTRHTKLHAHHVVYWSDGGRTDLANVVLVCSRHHTLIHAQGFQLVLHPDRRLEVRTADGVPVVHHPAQPWGDPAALAQGCGQRVSAETLPPDHCDTRLDLHYAVSVLLQQAA